MLTHTTARYNKEIACHKFSLWNTSKWALTWSQDSRQQTCMGLKKLASRLKLAKIEAQVGYGYGPASRGKEKKKQSSLVRGDFTRGTKVIDTGQRSVRNDCGLVKQTQWRATTVATPLRVLCYKSVQHAPFDTIQSRSQKKHRRATAPLKRSLQWSIQKFRNKQCPCAAMRTFVQKESVLFTGQPRCLWQTQLASCKTVALMAIEQQKLYRWALSMAMQQWDCAVFVMKPQPEHMALIAAKKKRKSFW